MFAALPTLLRGELIYVVHEGAREDFRFACAEENGKYVQEQFSRGVFGTAAAGRYGQSGGVEFFFPFFAGQPGDDIERVEGVRGAIVQALAANFIVPGNLLGFVEREAGAFGFDHGGV
jgi:hypothetical protein